MSDSRRATRERAHGRRLIRNGAETRARADARAINPKARSQRRLSREAARREPYRLYPGFPLSIRIQTGTINSRLQSTVPVRRRPKARAPRLLLLTISDRPKVGNWRTFPLRDIGDHDRQDLLHHGEQRSPQNEICSCDSKTLSLGRSLGARASVEVRVRIVPLPLDVRVQIPVDAQRKL